MKYTFTCVRCDPPLTFQSRVEEGPETCPGPKHHPVWDMPAGSIERDYSKRGMAGYQKFIRADRQPKNPAPGSPGYI